MKKLLLLTAPLSASFQPTLLTLLGALALAAVPSLRANVASTFGSGMEGWTLGVHDTHSTLGYSATGGHPGGQLVFTDGAEGAYDTVLAPAKFLGDDSSYYGGTLSFDALDNMAPDGQTQSVTITDASGNTLTHPLTSFTAGSYFTFSFPLTETSGWTYTPAGGSSTNQPTQAQFTSVLKHVASLQIPLDYHLGTEQTSIDNVILSSGTTGEATWDAGRDLIANEKPDGGAQETTNPNATVPQWSYGYRTGVENTSLTRFKPSDHSNHIGGAYEGLEGWAPAATYGVLVSPNQPTFTVSNFDPLGRNELFTSIDDHSGTTSTVIRFTAPANDTYTYSVKWHDLDPNGGDGAAGYVVINGRQVFGAAWPNGRGQGASTTGTVTLKAGDVIDVLLNSNGSDSSFDTAGIRFTVDNGQPPVVPGPTCAFVPGGLVSQYKAEHDANDSQGVNNGTLEGGATFAPGKVGQAFSFDGNSGQVTTPLKLGARATIEAWVNPSILTGGYMDGNLPGVSRRSIAGSAANEKDLAIGLYGGKLGAIYKPASGVTALLQSDIVVQTGQWYHIAVTLDGTTATLFVNGAAQGSGATLANYVPNPDFRIGSVSCCTSDKFGGLVDEVAVYDRALSASEIASIYNAGSLGQCSAPARGGLSETTFTVNGSAATKTTLSGPLLRFSANQFGRAANLSVRVQSTTTPLPNDPTNKSWTDLPAGGAGRMSYDAASGAYVLNTNNFPAQNGLYFRAIARAPGYPDSISNYVGTLAGASYGAHLPPVVLLIGGNTSAADVDFKAGVINAPSGTAVRIQTSTTPTSEPSWTDLADGQSGHMQRSKDPNFPDMFLLGSHNIPGGSGIYFRAIASGQGLDSISNIQGPFTITNVVPARVTVTVSPTFGGDGSADSPFLVHAGTLDIKATATTDSTLRSFKIMAGSRTLYDVTDGSKNLDYVTSTLLPGDYLLQGVAVDEHNATARAGSGAIFIRVYPSTSAAQASSTGRSETAAAQAPKRLFKLVTQRGFWNDPTTWKDSQGKNGVPGPADVVVIKDLTVRFPSGGARPNYEVAALNLNGGTIVGGGTLSVNQTFTGIAGSVINVQLVIKKGAYCDMVNKSDMLFSSSEIDNYGSLSLDSSGGLLLDAFFNYGVLHFARPISIPAGAGLNPAADIRVLAANAIPNLGDVSGLNTNSLLAVGGDLIAAGGGNLVAAGGGNVISNDSAGLIGQDGAGLIGQDGAGLIGKNGNKLVLAGGGSFVSQHGAGAAAAATSSRAPSVTAASDFTLTGGTVDLNAAGLDGSLTLNGGILSGSGTILGDLTNNGGYIAPGHSAGAINVQGNFKQTADGALILEVGGAQAGTFDTVEVAGAATLGGHLDLRTINGYKPAAADRVNPLGYGSVAGAFSDVSSNATVTNNATGLLAGVDPSKPQPELGQPINISTRLQIQGGDNGLTAGFIVSGPSGSTKKVIIRGLGPSTGVAGAISDPILELNGDGVHIVNDNWQQGDTGQIPNGFAPSNPKESVIVATLTVGSQGYSSFTAGLRDTQGQVGVGVVEVYDLNVDSAAQLANIATRGLVQTGADVLIGGFYVGGNEPAKVLVRVTGPSLSKNGVSGALQDPLLELHDANGAVISNDNWRETQESEIAATGIPPSDEREPAILTTLVPGGYTAVVRGVNDTTGVAVIEAYNVSH